MLNKSRSENVFSACPVTNYTVKCRAMIHNYDTISRNTPSHPIRPPRLHHHTRSDHPISIITPDQTTLSPSSHLIRPPRLSIITPDQTTPSPSSHPIRPPRLHHHTRSDHLVSIITPDQTTPSPLSHPIRPSRLHHHT